MEKLKKFFWLCSGAHIVLLKKCESESSKYAGIGATVFFTGVFAALAAGYALYTVFDNAWIASAFGLLWGLMIFNLDRYIVSSMRKEGSFKREIVAALPRIVLAVIISVVIAKPLELKIFEKEIQAELVIMEQQTYALQENEIKLRFQRNQEKLMNEVANMKNEVAVKTKLRNELDRMAREEADGTGGSKRRNTGPIYQIKKADATKANLELGELVTKNDALVQNKLERMAESDSSIMAEIAALAKAKIDGPAMRIEALSRLTQHSNAIMWASWFIMLLFIAIETAPVFVKLISPKGPYDHLLKLEEHEIEGQRIERLARIHADIKSRTQDLPALESEFISTRLTVILNKS